MSRCAIGSMLPGKLYDIRMYLLVLIKQLRVALKLITKVAADTIKLLKAFQVLEILLRKK